MPKVLLGFMGAGKTTIGSLLDPAFVDMDALLVQRLEILLAMKKTVFVSKSRFYCKSYSIKRARSFQLAGASS